MAPPFGLSWRSMSMPRCLADGSTWAANASLISTWSMSSIVRPARASAWRRRLDRAEAHDLRVQRRHARRHDAGQRRDARAPTARVSDITTTAAAPSLSGQALPAVTLPSGRNTGCSVASFSTVVPARGPSSSVTTAPDGRRHRDDLPVEEAPLLGGDGPLLRAGGELVHLLAADVLVLGHVLGRLAHGDVDVGQARRRRPRLAAAAATACRCARRPRRTAGSSARRRPCRTGTGSTSRRRRPRTRRPRRP